MTIQTQILINELETKRKNLLDTYRLKQPFKVSTGQKYLINGELKHARWFDYEEFNPKWRLREVLKDEIVIEFDFNDFKGLIKDFQDIVSNPGIKKTGDNLFKEGFSFSVWSHNGKSPHLHIQNLPIKHLNKEELKLFKEFFIKKFVPIEYHKYLDFSLCGVHLVRLEHSKCWKNKYGIKQLVKEFNPGVDNEIQ